MHNCHSTFTCVFVRASFLPLVYQLRESRACIWLICLLLRGRGLARCGAKSALPRQQAPELEADSKAQTLSPASEPRTALLLSAILMPVLRVTIRPLAPRCWASGPLVLGDREEPKGGADLALVGYQLPPLPPPGGQCHPRGLWTPGSTLFCF